MTGALYLGTSGFAYPDWKGTFYPEEAKNTDLLSHYSRRLSSVEINYTFRRYPSEETLAGWREKTPEGFRFALKANQRITHTLRLADADEAVSAFLERARLLGDRLGPILFQCPPTLRFDRRLIESFVGYLPPTFRYAMEFRHPSWEEARPILEGQGVAWCAADTDETAATEVPAEPFAYVRLRRDHYSEDELAGWSKRFRESTDDDRDVYCYVKHEAAEAPTRAMHLLNLASA